MICVHWNLGEQHRKYAQWTQDVDAMLIYCWAIGTGGGGALTLSVRWQTLDLLNVWYSLVVWAYTKHQKDVPYVPGVEQVLT